MEFLYADMSTRKLRLTFLSVYYSARLNIYETNNPLNVVNVSLLMHITIFEAAF